MRGKKGTGPKPKEKTPEQIAEREAHLNRPFTHETVKFVKLWYKKGDSIEKIALALDRSKDSIIKALQS